MNNPRVMLGVPCMDICPTRFAYSLRNLKLPKDTGICFVYNSEISKARNTAVEETLNRKFSHLLFIDSDMEFPDDALLKLLASGKSIVGGRFIKRKEPYSVCAWEKVYEDDDGQLQMEEVTKDSGLVEVDAIGTGFLLISAKVLQDVKNKYGVCFESTATVAEDILFCMKAKSLGYRIWLDNDVKCGHLGIEVHI